MFLLCLQVQLNLSELFPQLSWESVCEETARRDEFDVITLPSESEVERERESQLHKRPSIDKREYQTGSLLDRWARFESPPPEPVKVTKPRVLEVIIADQPIGCSAFRTKDLWRDVKCDTAVESSTSVVTLKEVQKESSTVIVEDSPMMPPTPPKETKTPPPATILRANNISAVLNGPLGLYDCESLVDTELSRPFVVNDLNCRELLSDAFESEDREYLLNDLRITPENHYLKWHNLGPNAPTILCPRLSSEYMESKYALFLPPVGDKNHLMATLPPGNCIKGLHWPLNHFVVQPNYVKAILEKNKSTRYYLMKHHSSTFLKPRPGDIQFDCNLPSLETGFTLAIEEDYTNEGDCLNDI